MSVIRIGEVRNDGLFEIVFSSPETIKPAPWNKLLPETQGYICDWSDRGKGNKYKLD